MGREGRKFKICSSCLLLLFTMIIIYFGETTVKRVKSDIKQWSEDELAKKLITQKINKEYNLKKALIMREELAQIFMIEVSKYHSQTIEELSDEGLNSLTHVLQQERIWNAVVVASFRLRSKTKTDILTKQEWEDTIEYFSYSLTEEDRQKAIKDQRAIFNKIAGKKNGDSITLTQYKKTMGDFKNFMLKVLSNTEMTQDQYPSSRTIFNYLSFEIGLYNDCHRKAKEGLDLNNELDEKCSDKKEANKFLIWILEDPTRWSVVSDNVFNIFDVDSNGIIEAREIDNVLLDLEFKDVTIRVVQELLIHVYERNNNRQITKQDFLQVMDRIRYLLQRYEEEMGNTNDDDF